MRVRKRSRARSFAAALTVVAAALISLPAAHAAGGAQVVKAPPPNAIDYDKLTQEATDFLSKYIKINTTNPPGNEMEAAKLLKEKFLSEGIPATTWEPEPGRGIIAARLRGIGEKKKALIVLSHMDVVPAVASEWKVPPFSGEVKDGYVWGRGALDDKGPGVIGLMSMLAIKRAGILLNRDIIFVATGDEEEGGKMGAGWFTEHEKDIFSDAGYLVTEGGGIQELPDGKKLYKVAVTEKTPLWIRLTSTGTEGHAAAPASDTSVTRLIRALSKVIDFQPRIRVIGPVQDEFHTIAELEHGPPQWLDLASSLRDLTFARKFLEDPSQNAKVRDTIAPTVLQGSDKTNIIPAVAYAEIDCRLLPGDDQKHFLGNIKKLINDDSIKIEVRLDSPPTPSSPSKSILMSAIEELARKYDKCPVVPTMVSGFTDSRYFRRRDIVSYGFTPLDLPLAEFRNVHGIGVHGIDERLPVKEIGPAIKRMTMLLEIFGKEK
jgi:acetylornithine deacetylase/succinyl-diaminopimelate desuccinylase-like protein